MSIASENLLAPELEQPQPLASTSIDLLDQGKLEQAVIIYDNSLQEADEVVKLVSSLESSAIEPNKSCDDSDNVITLHASSDSKEDETIENINRTLMNEFKNAIQYEPIQSITEIKENEGVQESQEVKQTEEAKENQEVKQNEEVQESQEVKQTEEIKENQEVVQNEEVKENQEVKQNEEIKENQEVKQNEEAKEKEEENDSDDDDETIATFVTSAGQQLALYAVENSDQVFAVALYDESGEPPTNFHFVMKDDVERLIEEGAVRTVKKKASVQPVQLKESQAIEKKDEIKFGKCEDTKPNTEIKSNLQQKQDNLVQKKVEKKENVPVPEVIKIQENKIQTVQVPKPVIYKNQNVANRNIRIPRPMPPKRPPNKICTNIVQTPIKSKSERSVAYIITDKNEAYILDQPHEDIDSDAEILEQSTVQYILNDDEEVGELTFDQLQRSLKSFDKPQKQPVTVNKVKTTETPKPMKVNTVKFSTVVKKSTPKVVAPILVQRKEFSKPPALRTYGNIKKKVTPSTENNLIQPTKIQIKQEMEDDDEEFDASLADEGHAASDSEAEGRKVADGTGEDVSVPSRPKVKRSRKQQLTVVNRPDSEIIIQAALVFSEEEEEEPVIARRRGRRKKRLSPDPEYNPRKSPKKTRKLGRSYEVIEIDVDENERSNVLDSALESASGEMTGKTKGSSDKENDGIISLDSSDEDYEEEVVVSKKTKHGAKPASVMQCSHCSRNFRKRKALEKHLHACTRKKARQSTSTGDTPLEKRFKCKTCNEAFDMAVTLARHVRIIHSPRKRGRPPKGWTFTNDDSDTTTTEVEEEEEESTRESTPELRGRGAKRRGRSKRWTSKDQSPSSDFELKLESSYESRRRGRPPARKSVAKERSDTPEGEEKSRRTSEPRRRGRPRKKSLSKEERSVSPEVKEKSTERIMQIPKKRGRPFRANAPKEERSATPEVDKKSEVDTPEPRRTRLLSKRSSSKDGRSASPELVVKLEKVTEKTTNNSESKVESSTESPVDMKKRKLNDDKSVNDNDSIQSASDDVIGSSTESVVESESKTTDQENTTKSSAKSGIQDKSDKDLDSKDSEQTLKEDEMQVDDNKTKLAGSSPRASQSLKEKPVDNKSAPEQDEKEASAIVVEQPKKGQAARRKSTKSESSVTSDADDKAESTADVTSESRRRGRSAKDQSSKDKDASESDEKIELRTRTRLSKSTKDAEKSTSEQDDKPNSKAETSSEPRTRSKLAKDKSSKDEAAVSSEAEDKSDSLEKESHTESRKRGRSVREKVGKDDRTVSEELEILEIDIDDDSDEQSKPAKVEKPGTESPQQKKAGKMRTAPSSNRSWKVKKLNCSDCGKWFSSVAALSTHCLQHRTKKSGSLIHRCRVCKKVVPSELYPRHLATVHKMTITVPTTTSTVPSTRGALVSTKKTTATTRSKKLLRSVAKPATTTRHNVRKLRSSN